MSVISPNSSTRIVVLGGANYDYMVRGEALPRPGETVEAVEFFEAPGGKGANQAFAAARLGAHTTMIARVGDDDNGRKVVAALESEGVDTSAIIRDAEASTGVALISVDASGEKQITVAPGANRRVNADDARAASHVIASAHVLLLQLEAPLEAVSEAVRIAHDAGVKILLDAAPPRELSKELLSKLHVLRANHSEAEIVSGTIINDLESAYRACDVLLNAGVKAVMIDVPGHGNLLASDNERRVFAKHPVASIDATGAGDALSAALAVMVAEGRSLIEAAEFANAAAAMATTVVGAQDGLPQREAVESLLRSNHA